MVGNIAAMSQPNLTPDRSTKPKYDFHTNSTNVTPQRKEQKRPASSYSHQKKTLIGSGQSRQYVATTPWIY